MPFKLITLASCFAAVAASAGSCYSTTTHQVTCDVAESACTGSWYAANYKSSRSGCCHCSSGCNVTDSSCSYNDAVEAKGSCYDMSTHAVSCNVATNECSGYWYEVGYTSSRSGCCHCSNGCSAADIASGEDTCTYPDVAQSPPPSPPWVEQDCMEAAFFADLDSPVNEPCYVHDAACVGYPVCCVTVGTCVDTHGGMVSSNFKYYEGGCYSDTSSKGTTAPGCGGKVGECNAHYLESAMGATSMDGVAGAVASAVTDRLYLTTYKSGVLNPIPCETWDTVTISFTLDGENMDNYGRYGGRQGAMCSKIAEAAGVASAYVSCSVEAVSDDDDDHSDHSHSRKLAKLAERLHKDVVLDEADAADRVLYERKQRRRLGGHTGTTTESAGDTGVILTADIFAEGTGVTGATVVAGLAEALGTSELAMAAFTPEDGSFTITITEPPTATAANAAGEVTAGGSPSPPPPPSSPPSAPPPTSPAVTIVIIAVGAVAALIIVGVILKMTVFKKAGPVKAGA